MSKKVIIDTEGAPMLGYCERCRQPILREQDKVIIGLEFGLGQEFRYFHLKCWSWKE